tara:strand:- start:548 stop:754 length:207 start_codon:yes stop_codon:yes gene_type:complete
MGVIQVKKIFIFLILNILVSTFSYAKDSQDLKEITKISDQLKSLQDQYKSGEISGYEYEKEKKKILNK